MNSTLLYWFQRINCILRKLQEFDVFVSDLQQYNLGAKCILCKLLYEARVHHSKAVIAFTGVIEIDNNIMHTTLMSEISETNYDNSSDSDSDSNSESDGDDDTGDFDNDENNS